MTSSHNPISLPPRPAQLLPPVILHRPRHLVRRHQIHCHPRILWSKRRQVAVRPRLCWRHDTTGNLVDGSDCRMVPSTSAELGIGQRAP